MARIIVAGGTGYMGKRLIPQLLQNGHTVQALVRPTGTANLGPACMAIVCNPLDRQSFAAKLSPADVWVHLLGVSHPSPAKAEQFVSVDLRSIQEAVPAAVAVGVRHFIYVSVAHPAPTMKAYIEVRMQGEKLVTGSSMNATILRPWYVLGEGHRWPIVLKPFYWLAERYPPIAQSARRLGLVSIDEMISALAWSVQNPPQQTRIIEVPEIRSAPSKLSSIARKASA